MPLMVHKIRTCEIKIGKVTFSFLETLFTFLVYIFYLIATITQLLPPCASVIDDCDWVEFLMR